MRSPPPHSPQDIVPSEQYSTTPKDVIFPDEGTEEDDRWEDYWDDRWDISSKEFADLIEKVFEGSTHRQTTQEILQKMGTGGNVSGRFLNRVVQLKTHLLIDRFLEDIPLDASHIPEELKKSIQVLISKIRLGKMPLTSKSDYWGLYAAIEVELPNYLRKRLRWVTEAAMQKRIYELRLEEFQKQPPLTESSNERAIQHHSRRIELLNARIQKVEIHFWDDPAYAEGEIGSEKLETRSNAFVELIQRSPSITEKKKAKLIQMLEDLPLFHRGFHDSLYAGLDAPNYFFEVESVLERDMHEITFDFVEQLFIQNRGNTDLVRCLVKEIHKRGKDQKIFLLHFCPHFPKEISYTGNILVGCMVVSKYDSSTDANALYIGGANILDDYRSVISPLDELLQKSFEYAFWEKQAKELYCHAEAGSAQERLWKKKGFEIIGHEEKEYVPGKHITVSLMRMGEEAFTQKSLDAAYEKLRIEG